MKPLKKGQLREEDDSGLDVQRSIVRERPIDMTDVILGLLKADDLKEQIMVLWSERLPENCVTWTSVVGSQCCI
jgi:hypothetical protein